MNSKMDEKISKLFLPIIDKLYHVEPAGEPFRFPVDPEKYQCWDYYHYVKHPIDLTTIRNKLVTRQYKDAWRCVTDLNLMFSNAYVFNKKGTPVYEWATKLNKIWNNELANVMPRLNYCCGALYKFGPQLLFCHGTTPDRYCQIGIGSKYKCYKDSYSFCIPCFNKIETKTINLQALTCETTRMKLPTQPVNKSDFADCTNDKWQYERFIQCTECRRRIHQICDLYPADEEEIDRCLQHERIEEEQKAQCCIPAKFLEMKPHGTEAKSLPKIECVSEQNGFPNINGASSSSSIEILDDSRQKLSELRQMRQPDENNIPSDNDHNKKQTDLIEDKEVTTNQNGISGSVTSQAQSSLDDDLLRYARVVDDMHSLNPGSPNPDENIIRLDSARDSRHKDVANLASDTVCATKISKVDNPTNTINSASSNAKNSVDDIAARLSSNKIVEIQGDDILSSREIQLKKRDKYVCNHCYKKDQFGFNLRHRKYSARRIPHTRMSRYIETKVNEYIRQNSPSAGEMTIRVLTAYRDTFEVKPEMREYLKHCKMRDPSQHPNLDEYPDQFEFTTRAIFAWQEIDGIDVCVFGMHVQEYGDDCPEPNKRVVYLSYLDSVHFFRPKQFRTAVYHEILLSYFKYVKKLGFRRVFIWVCPSRKGDDYIFYRHPTEQKMPTLKRLSDWYVHLLDKGCTSGIIERYQNIYEYAISDSVTSVLSMPYLSGDYWPGEFERLLKIMIESQKIYDEKMSQNQEEKEQEQDNLASSHDLSNFGQSFTNNYINSQVNRSFSQNNLPSPAPTLYQGTPALTSRGKLIDSANLDPLGSNSLMVSGNTSSGGDDLTNFNADDSRFVEPYTPSPVESEDQPLDLSKSNSTASPESFYDDDMISDTSTRKRRRRQAASTGYTKKRGRVSQGKSKPSHPNSDGSKFGASQKGNRKSSSVANKDASVLETLESPEQELIRNLERSFKRQKDGFIVVHLRECDCLPHYESQRRKEEVYFACDLMKGREPFLQLARQMNYEFSTVRRAKFSSLAMVKHLGASLGLSPICKACYSFDSSKRHYYCSLCEDFYLCTSCQESADHAHFMSPMATATLPDISEFLQECAPSPTTNSISSASSIISNKSYNDTNLESMNPYKSPPSMEMSSVENGTPLHRHLSNTMGPTPLSCKRQRNRELTFSSSRAEDEENAKINPFDSDAKLCLTRNATPPPSHSSNNGHPLGVDLDQMLVHNIMRQAQLDFDIDFDEMKGESKKLLSHYWECPSKDSCPRCKFVVLSCSFMSAMLRSPRFQMIIGNPEASSMQTGTVDSNISLSISNDGMNLTKSDHKLGLG